MVKYMALFIIPTNFIQLEMEINARKRRKNTVFATLHVD